MTKKYPFFNLQDGSNLIRFITKPYKFYSHTHNSKTEMCFNDFKNLCLTCLIEEIRFFTRNERQWMVGLLSENKKYILRMEESLYQEVRRKTQDINSDTYGDPSKFEFNLKIRSGYRKNSTLINRYYNIEAIKKYDASINDEKMTQECVRLTSLMKLILSNLSSVKEFQKFCLLCKKVEDRLIFDDLIKMVNNEYTQYSEALKTILLFS